MRGRYLYGLAATAAVLFTGCGGKAGVLTQSCWLVSPHGAQMALEVEVKNTDKGRATGLMYRRTLDAQSGMLFIWPHATFRQMWMRNTLIPLDMVFLYNQRIIGIIENTTPLSEAILTVESPANRVLEVNAGSLARWGVNQQWRLICQDTAR